CVRQWVNAGALPGRGAAWMPRLRDASGLRDLTLAAVADRFVVADDFGDNEVDELFREGRIELGVLGERLEPLDHDLFALRIARRQTGRGLQLAHPARAAEALGEEIDQRGVDVVDAVAQLTQLGRDRAGPLFPRHVASPRARRMG